MIQRRVDEHAAVVPCTRLDPNRLVNETALRHGLVGDRDSCSDMLRMAQGVLKASNALCLLNKATVLPSAFQITYFTGGVVNSASVFCCWMSYKTTALVELRIKLAVPP